MTLYIYTSILPPPLVMPSYLDAILLAMPTRPRRERAQSFRGYIMIFDMDLDEESTAATCVEIKK